MTHLKALRPKFWDFSHSLSIFCLIVLAAVMTLGNSDLGPTATHIWIPGVALVFLAIAVMTAVHHAEVLAIRIGPSLGALLLALSVTVIEVGMIVSLMSVDSPDSAVVARDTVFAALIIVTNGIIGVCLLLGGLRHRELSFHVGGASSMLTVLAVLAGLTMVLPNYTTSTGSGTYSTAQLAFASIASLVLYFCLVFSQVHTHSEYYEPVGLDGEDKAEAQGRPSRSLTIASFIGLIVSLVVVIGLAKALSPSIEYGVAALGAPRAAVGIVIALLVLAPEMWSAVLAARTNRLQTSLNLALGSGAASIALTIPVVSAFSVLTQRPLTLGLDEKNTAFLIITFIASGFTLGSGRTTALQGMVHLTLLCAYVAFSFIP